MVLELVLVVLLVPLVLVLSHTLVMVTYLTGISVFGGISTDAQTPSNTVVTLDLSNQDHKLTVTGITTITVSGGTEGDSHTVRMINSGVSTVGFSTYFLFPSGSQPSLPNKLDQLVCCHSLSIG